MSIIYDALKKVERSIEVEKKDSHEAAVGLKSKIKLPLFYTLIIILGFSLASVFFKFIDLSSKGKKIPQSLTPSVVSSPVVNVNQDTALTVLKENTNPTNSATSLALNGIFFSEGQGYALINNQIVRENDTIDGAKVLKITSNAVELDSAGATVILNSN